MAQIFRPRANSVAKLSLLVGAAVPVVALYAGSTLSRSPLNTKVDVPVNQPIPFSHRHHAWELGIDCRFCHTSVETSAVAGIPPVETCMTCHSQIWTNSPLLEPLRQSYATGQPIRFSDGSPGWIKVNKLPDFVYFNHSIHVNRGISCNTCHGPVQKMPITYKGNSFEMRWCLACHKQPEKFLYKDKAAASLNPRQQIFQLYLKQQTGEARPGREQALLDGKDYAASPKETVEGQKLIKQYGIKKEQLQDCWVCHN